MNSNSTDRKSERRLNLRRLSSDNVYMYCKQLEMGRCRPKNISARGAFVELIPKRAYVGRRVQLVFVIDRGATAKMIRVFAVIAHISGGGIGFGFIGKHVPNQKQNSRGRFGR